MELQHVRVKLFVDGELDVDLEKVMETFHGWVANQSLPELLIDVVDYRHVPHGPSVMLIGHEADYGLDNTDGRYGLIYNRKSALDGTNDDRLAQAIRSAAKVCTLLEVEFPSLKFSLREFEFTINDRAIAPNNAETKAACEPIITAFVQGRLGVASSNSNYDRDPRSTFGATISLESDLDWAALAAQ
ncbi:MAG: hypothetical protein O3A00_16240 [Planctomycetota bacterium]|nr:hypothetical protein [Planctomycetota bacterium]